MQSLPPDPDSCDELAIPASTSTSYGSRRTKSAPVGVVGKVIRIFDQLSLAPEGLLLREIVSKTEINKSTAYRFLAHLESAGYVFRDSDGHYSVGPRLARLGTCPTTQSVLCRASADVLERLRSATDETINLAALDRSEILYLSAFESPNTVRIVSELGMRRPLHSTAIGKAILAFMPAGDQERVLREISFEQLTPQTIGSAEELKKELLRVAPRGYAVDDEETIRGVRCIAVPLFDRHRRVIGGISISGPTVRIAKHKIASFAILLQRAADEIALLIGAPE